MAVKAKSCDLGNQPVSSIPGSPMGDGSNSIRYNIGTNYDSSSRKETGGRKLVSVGSGIDREVGSVEVNLCPIYQERGCTGCPHGSDT